MVQWSSNLVLFVAPKASGRNIAIKTAVVDKNFLA
jgi:hypothetical protein